MSQFVSLMTQKLIDQNIITFSDRDIYEFGLKRMLIISSNIITIVILGMIFNELLTLLVFTAYYLSLRAYAGGYHCDTEITCYAFSVMMILVIITILKYTVFSPYLVSMVLISSITSIIALAPVENSQKRLDKQENYVYRKKVLIRLSLEIVGMLVAFQFNKDIAKVMLLAIGMIAIMLHLGCVKNRMRLYDE